LLENIFHIKVHNGSGVQYVATSHHPQLEKDVIKRHKTFVLNAKCFSV